MRLKVFVLYSPSTDRLGLYYGNHWRGRVVVKAMNFGSGKYFYPLAFDWVEIGTL